MAAGDGAGVNHGRARRLLSRLPDVIGGLIATHLRDLADWGHRSARHIAQAGLTKSRLFEDESEIDLQRFLDLLLPAPPAHTINNIIFDSDWASRIASLSRLADPNLLANVVATGLARGDTQADIARELGPIVNNVRASAKRIARTESVRVGHEVQMSAWDELGTMVIGFQLHHSENPAQRWWHAERDGNIYYKNPQPGQLGLDQMPRPPMEPPDQTARPVGTPQVAPNCLCALTPVFAT